MWWHRHISKVTAWGTRSQWHGVTQGDIHTYLRSQVRGHIDTESFVVTSTQIGNTVSGDIDTRWQLLEVTVFQVTLTQGDSSWRWRWQPSRCHNPLMTSADSPWVVVAPGPRGPGAGPTPGLVDPHHEVPCAPPALITAHTLLH